MSFLYPAFLIGAIAIALPIVLHLLRRDEAPEVPFTAVRLLRRSPLERSKKRRLRDAILLAARILALLLLAAAFARPYVQGSAPARVRAVALDRSYSMGDAARFQRAIELARAAIDEAAAGERVALVAFDERAEVVAQPAGGVGGASEARTALTKIAPGSGATRYRALFDAIRELDSGAPGRLIVITDLQQSGWEGEDRPVLPAGWDIEVRDVGPPPANVAVTAVSTDADRVVVSVRNAGTEPRRGKVHAIVDGKEVAGGTYDLGRGEAREVAIAWRPPAAGGLTITIDDPGGLAADDTRHIVLDGRRVPKALVIASGDRGGLFVSRALETSRGEDNAIGVEVITAARVSSVSPGDLQNYPAIVLLSTRGLDRKGRDAIAAHVRGGAGLLVSASPDVEFEVLRSMADWKPPLDVVAQPDERVTLSATDLRHPIFRPFGGLAANLGQVRFDRAWRVSPQGWTVIAHFSNGNAALLERPLERGRVVLFASDMDRRWNDFPVHPGFVPFALETIRYAAGDRQASREYTVADAPAGVGPSPGIYTLPSGQIAAVNVDPEEGAPARMSPDEFTRMVQRTSSAALGGEPGGPARQTEARQSYWQYGLLVMIAALVAESFVGRS
jgi:hypothetical protein